MTQATVGNLFHLGNLLQEVLPSPSCSWCFFSTPRSPFLQGSLKILYFFSIIEIFGAQSRIKRFRSKYVLKAPMKANLLLVSLQTDPRLSGDTTFC